jgi:hypothetical protein
MKEKKIIKRIQDSSDGTYFSSSPIPRDNCNNGLITNSILCTTSTITTNNNNSTANSDYSSWCSANPTRFTNRLCVSAVYASPKTVLVTGHLIIETTDGNQQNPFIWLAVDGFKALGYSISSIQLSGQGSQGNPHDWLIVMSKP